MKSSFVIAFTAIAHIAPVQAETLLSHGIRFAPGEPSGQARIDSAVAPAESFREMVGSLEVLRRHPEINVDVAGHADRSECVQEAACEALSRRRAEMIRNWLVAGGIPATRLTSSSWGSSRPIDPADTADGRSRNRRVELDVQWTMPGVGSTRRAAPPAAPRPASM